MDKIDIRCRKCGTVLKNEKFCPECGEKVTESCCSEEATNVLTEAVVNPQTQKKKGGCLKFLLFSVVGFFAVLMIIGIVSDDTDSTDAESISIQAEAAKSGNARQYEVLEGTNQATLDALSKLCSRIKPIEDIELYEAPDGIVYYSIPHNVISKDLTLKGQYIVVYGVVDYVDVYEQLEDGTNIYRYDIITGEIGQANIGPVRYITYECFSDEKFNLNDPVMGFGAIDDSNLISVKLKDCWMFPFS